MDFLHVHVLPSRKDYRFHSVLMQYAIFDTLRSVTTMRAGDLLMMKTRLS